MNKVFTFISVLALSSVAFILVKFQDKKDIDQNDQQVSVAEVKKDSSKEEPKKKTPPDWLGADGKWKDPSGKEGAPQFSRDVLPALMKNGCNAGDCHGAARGKDGFMLSLFGYDPGGDWFRLLEEYPNRRINLAEPEKSLFLEKAIGSVTHSGGELFTKDDEAYAIIRDWIAAGAKRDPADAPTVTGIEVSPKVIEYSKAGGVKPTKVVAIYSDGSKRDVTRWSLFMSSNEAVVSIDDNGKVKANRSGGAHVFARFSRFTEGAEVVVLPEKPIKWNPPKSANYIDELVYGKLKKLQIHPSELSNDGDFLRRVTIDLIGQLPTPEEYDYFINSTDPYKRSRVIDELISRDEFAELWTAKWGEWLRIRTSTNVGQGTAPKTGWIYFYWLRDQFINDKPISETFQKMLTGTGSNVRNPVSNFYTMMPQSSSIKPQILGKDIAQVTMGMDISCAECHNHPFDRWTMDDYYSWTSFFTGIKRKKGRQSKEMLISVDVNAKPANHKLHGDPMPHRFLGGDAPDVDGKDPRKVLSDWMTSKDNRLFRRNIANRTWAHFFSRGIIEPVDDVRISNPASNEPLLEELGRRLAVDYNYKLRDLARDICNSTTYQLSAATNESNRSDNEFFSHASLRRPRADVLFDCLNQAMGFTPKMRGTAYSRAVQLFQGRYNDYFFSTFGQAKRESVCACETSNEANLAQSLHLMNGNTIQAGLHHTRIIDELRKEHEDKPENIIRSIYVRSLSREPTKAELEVMLKELPEKKDGRTLKDYYKGVYWAILNSSEFLFNH